MRLETSKIERLFILLFPSTDSLPEIFSNHFFQTLSYKMSTYSRSVIISLLKETLSQLRELSGQFLPCEPGDQFIIRLKMMENLARLAFNYSIKVSYLNECMEYAHMAEMLDDVLLQIRRANVGYKARNYGVLVMREYDAMYDALDLIDERLKTVRVVCFNSRSRKVSQNSKFADNEEDMTEVRYSDRKHQGSCWVDENGYRKRDLYPCELPANDSEPEYEIGRREQKLRDFSADYDCETMTRQFNIINTSPVPVLAAKTAEEKEADKKFIEFANIVKAHLSKFYGFTQEPTMRLVSQCKEITKLFKLLADNIEYISSDIRFRRSQKNGRYSFMQICISKCSQLYAEIDAKYDSFRRTNKRANPTLRSAKIEALSAIQNAKRLVHKYYIDRPVETETIEYIIANPPK
jgi:hypothetical protein